MVQCAKWWQSMGQASQWDRAPRACVSRVHGDHDSARGVEVDLGVLEDKALQLCLV